MSNWTEFQVGDQVETWRPGTSWIRGVVRAVHHGHVAIIETRYYATVRHFADLIHKPYQRVDAGPTWGVPTPGGKR